MKTCVIDASVILKAILTEDNKVVRRLDSLSKNSQIHSPAFLSLEVANGIRFAIKDLDKGAAVYQAFNSIPIELHSFDRGQIEGILNQSYKTGGTVYDSSYHFLAKMLNCQFLTCDWEYFQKAKSLGNILLC